VEGAPGVARGRRFRHGPIVEAAQAATLLAVFTQSTRPSPTIWAKRKILRFGRHPGDRGYDQRGRCSVCGDVTVFRFNSWSIDRELLEAWGDAAADHAYLRRESMFCGTCSSSLRVRMLASSLLRALGSDAGSVREAIDIPPFASLDVLEINELGSTGSMHTVLSAHPRLVSTEYRGAEGLGTAGPDGRLNEDLTALTFADATFDVVLHSDTLEHVPDPVAAMREVRRVIRPGGVHVFTVPALVSRPATQTRAVLEADGVRHLHPPLYHGRGAGPYSRLPVGDDFLEFTSFGADLAGWVAAEGFDVQIDVHALDDAGTGAGWVVVARPA